MKNKVRPKIKVMLAGIINVFSVAILLAVLFTPLGKLGTPAKAQSAPAYTSQWRITRVHYIKVIRRPMSSGGQSTVGKIVVGPSQYMVKYCIGGLLDPQTATEFGACRSGNEGVETWDVDGWTKATQATGSVVDDSMFIVGSGDVGVDISKYGADTDVDGINTTDGPLLAQDGNEAGFRACYQKGWVMRSGSYGVSFVATVNHTCDGAEYMTSWSYSEFPSRWKVTAT